MKHKAIVISLLVIVLLLIGCGTTKRVIDTKITQDSVMVKKDSLSVKEDKKTFTYDTILDWVNSQDKSIITITEYSNPDTSGKQAILRTTEIKRDITTNKGNQSTKQGKIEVKKDIINTNTTNSNIVTKIEQKEDVKKQSIWDKIGSYVTILAIMGIIALFVIYYNKIMLFIKNIISIFGIK